MDIPIRFGAGLVVYDSAQARYLILRRNPARYTGWGLIKGGVEEGETAQQACARETAEETGIIITPEDLIDLEHKCAYYDNTKKRVVLVSWFAHVTTHPYELTLERVEWVDARWATYDEALYELAWQSQQHVLRVAHARLTLRANTRA